MQALTAEVRSDERGKSAARKIRQAGRAPAVIYGRSGETAHVLVDPIAFYEFFRKSGNANTIVPVEVGGKTYSCIVRDVQRNPLTRAIEHIDFLSLEKGQTVDVAVRVVAKGRAAGMAAGGRLRMMVRDVRIRCPFDAIPDLVEYDITPLEVNDSVKASELKLPTGCVLIEKKDFRIITILGKQLEEEVAAAAPAEGAAEGAAATPAAATPAAGAAAALAKGGDKGGKKDK